MGLKAKLLEVNQPYPDLNYDHIQYINDQFFENAEAWQMFFNQITDKNCKVIATLVYNVVSYALYKRYSNTSQDAKTSEDMSHFESLNTDCHFQSITNHTNDGTPKSFKTTTNCSPFSRLALEQRRFLDNQKQVLASNAFKKSFTSLNQ